MTTVKHRNHSLAVWTDRYGQTHYSINGYDRFYSSRPSIDQTLEFGKAVIDQNSDETLLSGSFSTLL